MKEFKKKIKCPCGCGNSMFIQDWSEGKIIISTAYKGKGTFKKSPGVIIKTKKLIKLLNEIT